MSISEIIGGRHVRFTRTVRAEIVGQSIVADVWLEAVFPIDFRPELYSLGLKPKEGGGVAVELTPPFGPDVEIDVKDAGATRVDFGAQPTDTSWLDLGAELEGQMSDDRAQAISLEMALLKTDPGRARREEKARGDLMAGAATKPLRRI